MVHSISSDLQDCPLLDMVRSLNWAEKKCSRLIKQSTSVTATALCDVHECMYGVSVRLASNSFPSFLPGLSIVLSETQLVGNKPQSFVPSWDTLEYPMNVAEPLGKKSVIKTGLCL